MDQIKQAVDTATAIKDAVGSVASTVASALGKDAKSSQLGQFTVEDPQRGNVITTNFGVAIDDTDNSLKAGSRGPTLMEDFHFREKMTHFDHERIPERVVHARGAAAHGYFELNESMEEFTRAQFLCQTGKRTPVFVRFSTVLGSRGTRIHNTPCPYPLMALTYRHVCVRLRQDRPTLCATCADSPSSSTPTRETLTWCATFGNLTPLCGNAT
jgi:hypothetical protein